MEQPIAEFVSFNLTAKFSLMTNVSMLVYQYIAHYDNLTYLCCLAISCTAFNFKWMSFGDIQLIWEQSRLI